MGVSRSAILLLVAGCSAVDIVDRETEAERVYRRIRENFYETPIVSVTFKATMVDAQSERQTRVEPGTALLSGDKVQVASKGNGGMSDFIFTSNGKKARLVQKEGDESELLDPPRYLPRTVKDDLLLGKIGDSRRLYVLCRPGNPGSPFSGLLTSEFVLGRDLCDRPTLTYDISRPVAKEVVQSRVMLTYEPQNFSLAQIESAQFMGGTQWMRTIFVMHRPAAVPEETFNVEDWHK
jgi:hypothetical protein